MKRKVPSLASASKPVRYSPIAKVGRVVALTVREVELADRALAMYWGALQARLAELATRDDSVSARETRRRLEELEILSAKLGIKR